jgi:signal transduction histidine kinase
MTLSVQEAAGVEAPLEAGRPSRAMGFASRLQDLLCPWPQIVEAPDAIRQTERFLANARIVLAAAALMGAYIDSAEPHRFPVVAHSLVWLYFAFSVLVRLIGPRVALSPSHRILIHSVDLLLPCVLIAFVEGPSSSFYLLLPFVLLAAAARWGYRATVLTGAVGFALMMTSAVVSWTHAGPAALNDVPVDLKRLLMRATYLLVIAVMIGYLSERTRRLQAESAVVADMLGLARTQLGVTELVSRLAARLLSLYAARGALLAVYDDVTGHGALLEYDGADLRSSVLRPEDWAIYLASRGELCSQALRTPGDAIFTRLRCHALLFCDVRLGEGLSGRLFVLDPAGAPVSAQRLRLLATITAQVTPTVYNAHLLRRQRSRTAASERARLARELHDGVLQSLLGLELQVESYRRQGSDPATAGQFTHLRDGLRANIEELRLLMGRLQQASITPQNLGAYIKNLAARLRRESDTEVSVKGLSRTVACTRRGARELAGIVQEALANVRKHSGARHVSVEYSSSDSAGRIVIADDGRGFPWEGTLSGPALEQSECAPAVLLARTKALGGDLTVASRPGAGTRITVEWSVAHHE